MAHKMFVFRPEDLVNLLTHYSNGEIPLGAEVKNFGVNPMLERMIGLELESKEWEDFNVLQFRYDGNRVMSWSKNMPSEGLDKPQWAKRDEPICRK